MGNDINLFIGLLGVKSVPILKTNLSFKHYVLRHQFIFNLVSG